MLWSVAAAFIDGRILIALAILCALYTATRSITVALLAERGK
jgi:hypothetical protein